MRGGLGPSSTPPSPKRCGLVGGASPFGLQWVNKLKILGVYFSNGLVDVERDNWGCKLDKLQQTLGLWSQRDLSFLGRGMIWGCKLDKLQQTLGLWSQRDLSFLGRGMILNVFGASKFWHVAKVLPPPPDMGFS